MSGEVHRKQARIHCLSWQEINSHTCTIGLKLVTFFHSPIFTSIQFHPSAEVTDSLSAIDRQNHQKFAKEKSDSTILRTFAASVSPRLVSRPLPTASVAASTCKGRRETQAVAWRLSGLFRAVARCRDKTASRGSGEAGNTAHHVWNTEKDIVKLAFTLTQ